MKRLVFIVAFLWLAVSVAYSQTDAQRVYAGVGFGFDYGGIGGKIEYLPIKYLGLFGGVGYNLKSVGWNAGATCKILPGRSVSPNIMAFYGYNAAFKGKDSYAAQYDKVSYGFTFGFNVDIHAGSKGNKFSVGLFFPIRSKEFMDTYDAAKADSNIEMDGELLPIGFSFGYNFRL